MKRARLAVFALAALLALSWGSSALGCPVCFGDSDAPIVKGVEMSVLFMIGVTYSLMLFGVGTFFVMRRRALRRAQEEAAVEMTTGASVPPKNDRTLTAKPDAVASPAAAVL